MGKIWKIFRYLTPVVILAGTFAQAEPAVREPAAHQKPEIEAAGNGQSPENESMPESGAALSKTKRRSAKGSAREKEAEGSQAPNRFQADTVIKSKYELNGERLEVDPD